MNWKPRVVRVGGPLHKLIRPQFRSTLDRAASESLSSLSDGPSRSVIYPLSELAHFRRRLLQPIWHLHFAVHLHRDGDVLLSLAVIVHAAKKFA